MIRATIYENKEGTIKGYKVEDHAIPTVCNGVSMLSQTINLSLKNIIKLEPNEVEIVERSGYAYVKLKSNQGIDRAQDLLGALRLGLNELAYSYPTEIQVRTRRDKEWQGKKIHR